MSTIIPPPPTSTLFPYTTLFRSRRPASSRALGPSRRAPRPGAAAPAGRPRRRRRRSEEHTSELQSRRDLVCRLLLEKKKKAKYSDNIKISNKTMRQDNHSTQHTS